MVCVQGDQSRRQAFLCGWADDLDTYIHIHTRHRPCLRCISVEPGFPETSTNLFGLGSPVDVSLQLGFVSNPDSLNVVCAGDRNDGLHALGNEEGGRTEQGDDG